MARNQVATSINDLSDRIMQYGSIAGNREGRAADRLLKGAELDLADRRYTNEEARRSAADLRSQEMFSLQKPGLEVQSQESTDKLAKMAEDKATPYTVANHPMLADGDSSLSTASFLAKHGPDEIKFLLGNDVEILKDGTIKRKDGSIVSKYDMSKKDIQEKQALFWTMNADPVKHLEGILETGSPADKAKAQAILADKGKLYDFALKEKMKIYQYAISRGAPEEKLKMLHEGIKETRARLDQHQPMTAAAKAKWDKEMKLLDVKITEAQNKPRAVSESDKALIKNDAKQLGKLQEKINSVVREDGPDGKPVFSIVDDAGMKVQVPSASVSKWMQQEKDLTEKIRAADTKRPTAGLQPAAAQAQVAPVPQAAQPLKAPAPAPANQPKAANAQRDVKIIQMLKPDDPRLGAAVQEFLQRYPEMEEEVSRIIAEKQAGAAPAVVAPSWVTGLNKPSGVGR